MNKKFLFPWALCSILCLVFCSRNIYSSEGTEFLDEDVDFDAVLSDLPSDFDISTATVISLSMLPYFTLESAQRVVAARDSISIDQLVEQSDNFPGLSPMERVVLGYILTLKSKNHTLYPPASIQKRDNQKSGVRELGGSLRQGIVYNPDHGKVTDSRYYIKMLAKSQRMTVSLIGERDRFEPRAFDLVSGSAEYMVDSGRTTVIVGDYRPGFGQGLLFSRYGHVYGNGYNIMQRKPVYGINTSWDETRFLRGAFLSIRRNRITTETWFSSRFLDATLDDAGHAVTIRESGIHNSGQNRENLTETSNGVRCEFSSSSDITFAATGVISSYSPSFAHKERESSSHDPEGATFRYISIDGSFRRGPAVFFFEHAVMNRTETGTITGVEFSKLALRGCIAARRYSEGYWSYRAGGFSAFSNTSNEQGVYSAIQADLPGNMNLIASMDLARMLYRTESSSMPQSRKRLNIVLSMPSRRGLYTWVGYRSVDDASSGSERRNIRVVCEKRMVGHDLLRLRPMFAWSDAAGNGGPYIETSLLLRLKRLRCSLAGGLFDLPSYDARFYHYENDVPGGGYTRPVWGRGGTIIVILRWNLFSLRYQQSNSNLMDKSQEFTMQLDTDLN